MQETGSSLPRRALAAVVLVLAAYVLLKLVIGMVTAMAWAVAAVVAVAAIVWALRAI